MAATRSFSANEDTEASLVDDDLNDPDIEARLYGEIYYSNDTYPDQPIPQVSPTTLINLNDCPSGSDNRSHHWSIDTQPGQSGPLLYAVNHNSQDFAPPDSPHYSKRKRHRALIDGPIEFTNTSRSNRNYPGDARYPALLRHQRTFDSHQRFGSRNDYPRENIRRRENGAVREKSRRGRDQPFCNTIGNPEEMMEEEGEPDRTSLTALDEAMTVSEMISSQKSSETPENRPQTSQSAIEVPGNSLNTPATPAESQNIPVVEEKSKDEEKVSEAAEIVVNSKYAIKPKKSKRKEKHRPLIEDPDSDDSILEVPVPPKPVPPLISLPDSDEDSSSSEEESLVIMNQKSVTAMGVDTSKDSSSSSAESSRASSPEPAIIVDGSEDDTRDGDNGETINENLIINCTSIQKGVSSLEEIKKMSPIGGKNSNVNQSDEESMTESEAMNWGSLEGEISTGGELEKISRVQAVTDLWHEFSDESDSRRNLLDDTGSSGKPNEETQNIAVKNSTDEENKSKEAEKSQKIRSDRSKDKDEVSAGGEKRAHTGGNSNGDEGETPPKKKKRQKENQSKEMSLQEYLLQPMPKGLKDFYDEPRGRDMMRDMREIQSDMPKNPSRWMVLDADMYPVQRRKGAVCSICQREGHLRSRCPERPSAPICHICGVVGHREPRCPDNKKCISCGTKYSTCRKTCERCIRFRCTQCNAKGHSAGNCPDNWRKYHQTTSGTAPNPPTNIETILKPPNQLSCSNCTRRGHDATTCTNYRWSGHFIQPCFVRDYTLGPCYTPPTPQLLPPPETPMRLMPDFRESINIERLGINVNGPSTYLFHFKNIQSQNTSTWKECSLIPHHLRDVIYPPSIESPVFPKFLKNQFTNCPCAPMEVFVQRSYEFQGVPVITMRTPDNGSLEKLKVLIHQWLTRPPDDKEAMQLNPPLPHTREQLLQILSLKFLKFRKKNPAYYCGAHMQCQRLQERIAKAHGTKGNSSTKKAGKLNQRITSLNDLKFGCVVATYKYLLIDTPMDALSCFYDFFREIQELDSEEIPAPMFITGVWYCFELFTPHLSPTIFTSMRFWEQDPMYHVRGEAVYKMWYAELFKHIAEWKPTTGRNAAAKYVHVSTIPALLSLNLNMENLNASERDCQAEKIEVIEVPESPMSVVDVEDDFAKSSEGGNSLKGNGSNAKAATLMDLWLNKLPARGQAKELTKMQKKQQKMTAKDLKQMIVGNTRLGLPKEMPLVNDPRTFSPQFLEEYTHKALEFMKQRDMKSLEVKALKILETETENGIADKTQLIACWQMIRQELIKRRKSERRRGKKKEKKRKSRVL